MTSACVWLYTFSIDTAWGTIWVTDIIVTLVFLETAIARADVWLDALPILTRIPADRSAEVIIGVVAMAANQSWFLVSVRLKKQHCI